MGARLDSVIAPNLYYLLILYVYYFVDLCVAFIFFWTLRCMSFSDLRILITPLVSSNSFSLKMKESIWDNHPKHLSIYKFIFHLKINDIGSPRIHSNGNALIHGYKAEGNHIYIHICALYQLLLTATIILYTYPPYQMDHFLK